MRDEFSPKTKETIAKRAGYVCSNPDCRCLTVGAAPGNDGFVNVGVAAHITAAAPGGPRYDGSLTPEQRRSQSNGLWACQTHAKLIDSDSGYFTAELLREWKQQVEEESFRAIVARNAIHGQPITSPTSGVGDRELIDRFGLSAQDGIESVTTRMVNAAKTDVAAFMRMPGWPGHVIKLNLKMTDGESVRAFNASGLAAAIDAFSQIVVIAPPGTGKTTTMLQLTDAILSLGTSVAVFVPLGEWSSQPNSFFGSVVCRTAFGGMGEEHLKLLAHCGRLVLILDGWNELDAGSRKRASAEVNSLLRDFPDLGVVISTRRQALDVPISGPMVEIDALTQDQQLEIARALRGTQGEAILDHAWRTPGIRELVAIPLYLTALLTHTPDGSPPTTKEEVLRAFVAQHERANDTAQALRETLHGFHTDMLTALAVEATRVGTTTIADDRARRVVKQVEDRLSVSGQISAAPQPTAVLDILVSRHILVLSGTGGVAFQHQQLQEWYASFEVESLIREAAAGDREARRSLRVDVLNIRTWEEPILFACERISRTDQAGQNAVATAILDAIPVDPMLAAEMIYRSSAGVWKLIKNQVVSFIDRWHTKGKVDRAVRFMISTGRSEFAPEVWTLIAHPNDQVYLAALRAGRRFRPSVLGSDAQRRIAALPEQQRKHVISEIASESGIDGIELAVRLAIADASPEVQVSVIEALQFRRADRFVTEILRNAPDEIWHLMARKGYAEEVADPDSAARLREERQRYIESETDSLRKLRVFLDAARGGAQLGREVGALIQAVEFPVKDQSAGWLIDEAHKLYPGEVISALLHRLEAGQQIPFHAEDLLRVSGLAVDDGPLVMLVAQPNGDEKLIRAAVGVVGQKTVSLLIDQLVQLDTELRTLEGRVDEPTRERYFRLSDWISKTGLVSFVQAILSRSDTDEPQKIALIADLLARHGKGEDEGQLQLGHQLYEQMIATVERWGEALLASPVASRAQLAELARAIERLAAPKLLPVLRRMLKEDLSRWRRARNDFAAAHARGAHIERHPDSYTSWTLQYRRAFAAIGDDQVVETMSAYLSDVDFGLDAACVLKHIWDRAQNSPKDKPFKSWPDFSEVRARRIERQSQKYSGDASPFVDVILTVVDDLTKQTASESAYRHALQLAKIAFSMPYGNRAEVIDTLLRLPLPIAAKQELLTVLVLAGEVISADTIFGGIKAFLEEAKTKRWLLDENHRYILNRWLEILPFSDRPAIALDVLELLGPQLCQPWQLRHLLSALGHAPSDEAERVLELLARKDAQFFSEHEWLAALENRGTVSAGRILLKLLSEANISSESGNSALREFSKQLASAIKAHSELRAEAYQQHQRLSTGIGKAVLAQAIANVADAEGVRILIKGHAIEGKPFNGLLYSAIRHVALSERPSRDWLGSNEVFSVAIPELRKMLFGMIKNDDAESKLAISCLNAIDEIRDDYGDSELEPRHPDVQSGRPWPLAAQF